jgi:hypothetical protein
MQDESITKLEKARPFVPEPLSAPLFLEVQHDLYRLMAEAVTAPETADQFNFEEVRVWWTDEPAEPLSRIVEIPNEFTNPRQWK